LVAGCTNNAECDDGDKCTKDTCVNGKCVYEPLVGCGWCETDADGDGYYSFCNPGDCDDSNAAIFPGAQEVCDDLDNDCDGQVDEGCPDSNKCKKTGCSGQICADHDVYTTCEWMDWYACFQSAECGPFGPNGECAWKWDDESEACFSARKE